MEVEDGLLNQIQREGLIVAAAEFGREMRKRRMHQLVYQ